MPGGKYSVKALFETLTIFGTSEVLWLAEHVNTIPGFLTVKEGMALFHLAAIGPGEGSIVEIGSFQGRSTVWLGRGTLSTRREKVIAIDPHTGSSEHQVGAACAHMMPEGGSTLTAFRENLQKFGAAQAVEEKIMTSLEAAAAWNGAPIRLLFLDGAHELEAVESDFLHWSPKLAVGGMIALHDINIGAPGPEEVAKKYITGNPQYQILVLIDSLLIAQKVS